MPFKDDSPFEKSTGKADMDLENGMEIQKPLLNSQDETQTEGQDVEDNRIEGEKVDLQQPLPRHVHFSESLQRALSKKERDEELGLNKDDDHDDDYEEEEEEGTWEDFWEWVKAETKCYANYICPVVLVNACILLLVIVYFYNQKN